MANGILTLAPTYWDNDGTLELTCWSGGVAYWGDKYITDRTQEDIAEWEELRQKVISQTATEDEFSAWLNMSLRGCLNYKDFNRYGRILIYLAQIATQIRYPYTPKINWRINDNITSEEVNKLLSNIQTIRDLTGNPPQTPQVPTEIKDYNDANDIERILAVGNQTIINTQLGFRYCGDTYAGGAY